MNLRRFIKGSVVLVGEVETASGVLARMKGLLGRTGLGPGKGMYITPCMSIHTFFMRFPIDAIFLDRQCRVVSIRRNIRPWRIAWGGFAAAGVLEVESGWLAPSAVIPGDEAGFSDSFV